MKERTAVKKIEVNKQNFMQSLFLHPKSYKIFVVASTFQIFIDI